MEKPWAIVSGGRFSPLTDLEKCGYIIACDKGYVYLAERGLRPDLLVGDFDSYTGPCRRRCPGWICLWRRMIPTPWPPFAMP